MAGVAENKIRRPGKDSTGMKDMAERMPAARIAGILFVFAAFVWLMLPLSVRADMEEGLIAGNDRYETAAMLAAAYAECTGEVPEEVIVVTGQNFPDALSANALAGARKCPILLCRRTGRAGDASALPDPVVKLLKETWQGQVRTVTFVGGGFDPAVAEAFLKDAGAAGVDTESFAGKDRYETAEKVCRAVMNAPGIGANGKTVCFLATGRKAADALSAAAWSYAYKIPILLADAKGGLTQTSLNLAKQFDRVILLGAGGTIATDVEDALGEKALRIGGNDRYETSAAVAYHFLSAYAGNKTTQAVFAPGKTANFPDALAAGPLAGSLGMPVVLVGDAGLSEQEKEVLSFASAFGGEPSDRLFVGAAVNDTIPQAVRTQTQKASSTGEESPFLTGFPTRPADDAGIAAGVYEIRTAMRTDLAVTVPGNAVNDVTLCLDRAAQAAGQKFVVTPLGGGLYSIVSASSGRSLDIPSASTQSRTAVSQHRRNQSAAQQFYIRRGPDNTCTITPSHTDKPVGIRTCSPVRGQALEICHYRESSSQFFVLEKTEEMLPESAVVMIHSAADDSLVLTMASASAGNGVALRLDKAASDKASLQRFTISHLADGWFITPVSTFKALDVKGGVMSDRTGIQQYTWNGSAAQNWLLQSDGSGCFKIASAKDPAYRLTPSAIGGGTASDVVIRQALGDSEAAWQSFSFEVIDPDRPLPDGVYNLASFGDPTLVFDIAGASRSLKANARLHTANGTGAQQFSVLYTGNGFYKIKNVNSAMTLDRAGGSAADGTNIQQYKDNGSEAQQWKPAGSDDGSWRLLTSGGQAIGFEGNAPANNANLCLMAGRDPAGQTVTFKPVKVSPITDIRDMAAGSLPEDGTYNRTSPDAYFAVYPITQGDAVYSRMIGKSYPQGCPIPLTSLRYIKALHINFDGRVQVGEMVVNASIAQDVTDIFKELFKAGYQIRQMRLVDDFWTGDAQTTDIASVTADNSAAFNYRRGANQSTGLSNHAYGCAVDINPRENPYIEFDGAGRISYYEPANAAPYLDRSNGNPHYITNADLCCRLFKLRGFRWLGDNGNPVDYQHFERMN